MTLATPPRHPRRVVYLGTPAVAVPPLLALHEAGVDVALVVSGPDKRRGRGGKVEPSPVKAAALELDLPVTDDLSRSTTVGADLGVVVAYGRLIPTSILEVLPMINIHFSALPRWRGAAPVERALLAGDETVGVCLMEVAEELDTGDVYRSIEEPVAADDTLESLRGRLVERGSALLVQALTDGLDEPVAQTGEVTYAAKISADEYHLDLTRPAVELDRVIRLGRAWTLHGEKRLKVLQASVEPTTSGAPGDLDGHVVTTGDGGLRLITVQPEGKRPMAADAWRNGFKPGSIEKLG